jgi:ubiquinone/menaquinone biosynthesis C-methylase UbiE
MLKALAKKALPPELQNLLRRWALGAGAALRPGMSSAEYWTRTHVDAPEGGFASVAASLEHFDWRNCQYPGTLDLMPVAGHDGKVILDYGCGPGNDTIGFAHFSRPARLIAADVSPTALALAERRVALHGAAVEFLRLCEDPVSIPLPDASVDLIHTAGVLHHTPDPQAILREFRRILKPGGAVQVMVYNRDSLWMHLFVVHDMMLCKGLYKGLSKEAAFQRTTDGDACPIARCYRRQEFLDLAAGAGLAGTFAGAAASVFEMTFLPRRWEAIKDKRLDADSRHFLVDLTIDGQGYPRYRGAVAGINGCYHLHVA